MEKALEPETGKEASAQESTTLEMPNIEKWDSKGTVLAKGTYLRVDDDGMAAKVGRVEDVYKLWLEGLKQTTSASNYEPIASRWRTWVLPIISRLRFG